MGVYTIYPKPNLSKHYHSQYILPYLLKNLSITQPDQVCGIYITYIRMAKGFMYLFIISDWYSRRIVDFELSSTLEKTFVTTCLKRALSCHKPGIINSDQGDHFVLIPLHFSKGYFSSFILSLARKIVSMSTFNLSDNTIQ